MRVEEKANVLWLCPEGLDLVLGESVLDFKKHLEVPLPATDHEDQAVACIDLQDHLAVSSSGLKWLSRLVVGLRGKGYFPVILVCPATQEVIGRSALGQFVPIRNNPFFNTREEASIGNLEKDMLWHVALETEP